jgi:hypothetical protein
MLPTEKERTMIVHDCENGRVVITLEEAEAEVLEDFLCERVVIEDCLYDAADIVERFYIALSALINGKKGEAS